MLWFLHFPMQTSAIVVSADHIGPERAEHPSCRSWRADLSGEEIWPFSQGLWSGWRQLHSVNWLWKTIRREFPTHSLSRNLSCCRSHHVFDMRLWEPHYKVTVFYLYFFFFSDLFPFLWLKHVAAVIEVHCWSCCFHRKAPIMSGKQMGEKSCLIESKYLEQYHQSFGWELI